MWGEIAKGKGGQIYMVIKGNLSGEHTMWCSWVVHLKLT